jgi:hypothetical protein
VPTPPLSSINASTTWWGWFSVPHGIVTAGFVNARHRPLPQTSFHHSHADLRANGGKLLKSKAYDI